MLGGCGLSFYVYLFVDCRIFGFEGWVVGGGMCVGVN